MCTGLLPKEKPAPSWEYGERWGGVRSVRCEGVFSAG